MRILYIYLIVSSYNSVLLNFYLNIFVKLCILHKIEYKGPVYLPKLQKQFIFLKPVHIYKKSGTGFELITHKRLFIFECSDILMFYKIFFFLVFLKYRLPLGICFKITYFL